MRHPSPFLFALAGSILVVGCSDSITSPPTRAAASPSPSLTSNGAARKDILYQLRDDASPAERRSAERVLARYGIERRKTLAAGKIDHGGIANGNGRSEREIADELEATGAVVFAEVDELLEPAILPVIRLLTNDPFLTNQWHHTTIHSPAAWDQATGSTDIKVGICDSGVDRDHPDLLSNVPTVGWNLVDNVSGGGPNPATPNGHGTHVSGVVAAVGNNGEGVVGVNWVSNILPIRVSNLATGSAMMSTLIACVDFARAQGAKLVNISYTGVATSAAVNTAGLALMDAGGLLVVAAGNDNANFRKSTNYPGIIVAAATDQNDAKATFSNYGPFIDIAAPGVAIWTTRLTTNVNGIYGAVSGTSFSSPMVAAVAALIWARNPGLTPQSVQNILFTTTRDLGAAGYDQTFGWGRVDAGAALLKAATAVNPVPGPVGGGGGGGPGRGGGKPK